MTNLLLITLIGCAPTPDGNERTTRPTDSRDSIGTDSGEFDLADTGDDAGDSPAAEEPAHVQSGYGECYPATTCDVGFGVPGIPPQEVSAGNLVVVTVRTDNTNGPVTAVTSQPGGAACTLAERKKSVTEFWLEVWSCADAGAGAVTVTVDVAGPPDALRVVLDEYSAIAAHGSVVSATDTGPTADAGDIVTTVPSTLIHATAAADGNDDAEKWTAGPGYDIHDLGGSLRGSDKTMTQHRLATVADGYATSIGNIDDSWAAVAVAYTPGGR